MGSELILGIINIIAPIVVKAYNDHVAEAGTAPTHEQLLARIAANKDLYLSEGEAWKATHPNV